MSTRSLFRSPLARLLVLSFVGLAASSQAHNGIIPDPFVFDNSDEGWEKSGLQKPGQQLQPSICSAGSASGYPCKNVDLAGFIAPSEMGGGNAMLNDVWGWTDPVTGKEIAIIGRLNGTSFVDVSDPSAPIFLGFLPTEDGSDTWRDIKVYQDHAFVVADGLNTNRNHGLQVLDLSQLFNIVPGSDINPTAVHEGFGNAHNIAINEDSGFAYVLGSNQCSGGLYMLDISVPEAPAFAGCFSADGYTHDAQCVIYQGPDTEYSGKEVCAAFNEDTLTLVDVSNKSNPVMISRTPYTGSEDTYTHQGWFLDETHRYIVLNDEFDELATGANTTSYVFDVSQLSQPQLAGRYAGPTEAIDHNLYTKNGLVFETNYRAGMRVLGQIDASKGCLAEVAYFDTIPNSNAPSFSGVWSSYIYFASGNIVASDIEHGAFILSPDQAAIDAELATLPSQAANCDSAQGGGGSSVTPPLQGGGSSGGGVVSLSLSVLLALLLFAYRGRKWWKTKVL